jgi:hypothetical protein
MCLHTHINTERKHILYMYYICKCTVKTVYVFLYTHIFIFKSSRTVCGLLFFSKKDLRCGLLFLRKRDEGLYLAVNSKKDEGLLLAVSQQEGGGAVSCCFLTRQKDCGLLFSSAMD